MRYNENRKVDGKKTQIKDPKHKKQTFETDFRLLAVVFFALSGKRQRREKETQFGTTHHYVAFLEKYWISSVDVLKYKKLSFANTFY